MTTLLPNPTPVRRSSLTAAAKRAAIVASILLPILAPFTPCALAQPMRDRSPSAPPPGAVSLDLAGELELGILIDLISDRLGINIVSSSQAESKKIRIRAPESIPDAALMSLLELSLRTHNLILAPAGDDHWFTILDSKDLLAAAGGIEKDAGCRGGVVFDSSTILNLNANTKDMQEPKTPPAWHPEREQERMMSELLLQGTRRNQPRVFPHCHAMA